jgi:hypothetical protein
MVRRPHPQRLKRKHSSIADSTEQRPAGSAEGEQRGLPRELQSIGQSQNATKGPNHVAINRSNIAAKEQNSQIHLSQCLTDRKDGQPESSSSTSGDTDAAQPSGRQAERLEADSRTKSACHKVLRMTDIMAIIYGLLDPLDKIRLIECSSGSLRLGARVGKLRQDQAEEWLTKWTKLAAGAKPKVSMRNLRFRTMIQYAKLIDLFLYSMPKVTERSSRSTDMPLAV